MNLQEQRCEFQLNDDSELELIDHDSGETVASVPVDVPFSNGTAKNLRATERACQKVFGGHHWLQKSPRLEHEPETRICKLCGLQQRHVDKWIDDN